jgi:hypothetical protein
MALTRLGIVFTDQQKAQLKAMQESGNVMEAQTLILRELEGKFGGAAEAAGKTFSGKLAILKNRLGDIGERIGGAIIPMLEKMMPLIDSLAKKIEVMASAIGENTVKIALWVGGIGAVTLITGKVIASITAIIKAIDALTTSQVIMQALSGPTGWAMLAAGMTIAAGASYGLSRALASVVDEAKQALAESKKLSGETKNFAIGSVSSPSSGSVGGTESPSSSKAGTKTSLPVLRKELETLVQTKSLLEASTYERYKAVEAAHAELVESQKNERFWDRQAQKERQRTGKFGEAESQRTAAMNQTLAAEKAVSDALENQQALKDGIARTQERIASNTAAQRAESERLSKHGKELLDSVGQQLQAIGQSENAIADFAAARELSAGRIDKDTYKALVAANRELRFAKERESVEGKIKDIRGQAANLRMSDSERVISDLKALGATAEQIGRAQKELDALAKAGSENTAKATSEQTSKAIDDRIKELEKQSDRVGMSDTQRTLVEMQDQGATQEQLAKAQAALVEMHRKMQAMGMQEAGGLGGDAERGRDKPAAFESVDSLYRRIATSSASGPEDRTAKATEDCAKYLKWMRDNEERKKTNPRQAVTGP